MLRYGSLRVHELSMSKKNKNRQWTIAKVSFFVDKRPVAFNVVHNLDLIGLNFETALESWFPRTEIFTVECLCEYITSKDPESIICMPEEKYNELAK